MGALDPLGTPVCEKRWPWGPRWSHDVSRATCTRTLEFPNGPRGLKRHQKATAGGVANKAGFATPPAVAFLIPFLYRKNFTDRDVVDPRWCQMVPKWAPWTLWELHCARKGGRGVQDGLTMSHRPPVHAHLKSQMAPGGSKGRLQLKGVVFVPFFIRFSSNLRKCI